MDDLKDWPVLEESDEEPPEQLHVAGMIIVAILVVVIICYFVGMYTDFGFTWTPGTR